MPDTEKVFGDSLKDKLTILGYRAPWYLVIGAFRLLYGFEAEGFENIPELGPFITLVHEPSLLGVFVAGWTGIEIQLKVNLPKSIKSMGFMQDQLFALSYFRSLQDGDGPSRHGALVPHSAGRMALSLVDGYRTLRDGGTVSINPEGDGPWDGRPLATRNGPAWLGLHTGAVMIPLICSLGAYDIWPRWARAPYLRGKLRLTIGKPFRVSEEPLARASDEELEKACASIRAEFDTIRYGPGGVSEWAGPPRKDGAIADVPTELRPAGSVVSLPASARRGVPVSKRGIAQLLWRCPVCHTNDALLHRRPLLRPEAVECLACGTRWRIKHVYEHDFRLEVVEGASDLVGLDMALTTWYDEMKSGFQPEPLATTGIELLPGEQVVLEASGVTLSPHKPNPLFDEEARSREAPEEQPGPQQLGEWASIGKGRMVLTNQRAVWQGEDRVLEFRWSRVTAVYLWMRNTLGLLYGTARYRIGLGTELGLKWLTYAGTLAQNVERESGSELTLTQF